jgi:hypothetical protein
MVKSEPEQNTFELPLIEQLFQLLNDIIYALMNTFRGQMLVITLFLVINFVNYFVEIIYEFGMQLHLRPPVVRHLYQELV